MKRILYLIAVAALIIPVACEPQDKPKSDEVVELADPATREVAQVIEFAATDRLTIESPSSNIIKTVYAVELTDAGRAIITSTSSAIGPMSTKAVSMQKVEVQRFAQVDKKTFEVANFGTISMPEEKKVIVQVNSRAFVKTLDGETFTTTNALIRKPAPISFISMKNAARTWKVNSTILEVKTEGSALKETFPGGCDLATIAKFAADHGVAALKDKLSKFNGYTVDEIIFSSNGSFLISFTGEGISPFAGTVNMKNDGSFSYSFGSDGNSFFNASSNGSVSFTKDGKMNLSISSTIEGMTGTLKMNCSEAR